jgi:MoaA/NifB/PqqE/SkfB family radical SAM enzyme
MEKKSLAITELFTDDYSSLMINYPFDCDEDCNFCINFINEANTDRLSTKDYQNIIVAAKELGAKVLVIAGRGEPLYSEWKETTKKLVKHAAKLNLQSYIFTNGRYLDPKTALFLKKHDASICISFPSLNKENFLKIRTNGDFKATLSNIKETSKIYKDTIKDNKYRLVMNNVLTVDNEEDVKELKAFCEQQKILYVVTPVTIRGKAEDDPRLNEQTNKNIKKKALQYSDLPGNASTGHKDHYCLMGFGIAIDYNGNLIPCAYAHENALGNIRDAINNKNLLKHKLQNLVKKRKQIQKNTKCWIRD